ncbi:hypothetical protein U1Q18_003291 [Sarracenia purpurea var. burkii]
MDPKVSVEVKHQGDSSGGATSKASEEGEVEETVLGKVEENQGYVDDKSKYEIDTGKAMMKMVSSSGELDAIEATLKGNISAEGTNSEEEDVKNEDSSPQGR